MELSYWQSRWEKGNTGFHMPGGYPGLRNHWDALNISTEAQILVPLCGKTPDMVWLATKTDKVTGVEISEKAIREFFDEQNLTTEQERFANFTIFKTRNIELWCGDFFKLPEHKFPETVLIYDKAALQALPEPMRIRYAEKIISICSPSSKILLHHFTYAQNEMNGPPFSVSSDEIQSLFGNKFEIQILEQNNLDIHNYQKFWKRGLKSNFIEYLLLLSPKADN
ncbi:MAG: thiopurine S-methyltransferase [Balneolaceae bacterium]|nr:thiopurine S-methyltransferase [Balneolaceae bacterium]